MSKALTVAGPHTLKKMTVTTAAALEIVPANADKRTLVYIKNNAASATGDIKVFTNHTGNVDTTTADELIMEIAHGEFALFPATLDHEITAQALSADAAVEVGTFVIGDDFA